MTTAWLGKTIGNCRIDEKIGEGGCGQVFRGVDLMLDRQVAIKVLHPSLAARPDIAERFRSEAHAMARLSHPNVATLYSFHRESDSPIMVMEYVEGDTFEALLKRDGPMKSERAIPLLLQALAGVGHAHRQGIVHRDLKATNLMLNEAGVVKVMDFGIAQGLGQAESGASSQPSQPVGTPEYMSPEQVRGERLDGRADLYALGVLLFKLLTGRLPIRGDTPNEVMRAQLERAPRPIRSLVPSLAESVAQVVEHAMAKSAADRFADAELFGAALEATEVGVESQDALAAGPTPTVVEDPDSELGPTQLMWEPPISRWSRRARGLAIGGIGTLLLMGFVVFWLGQTGRVSARPSAVALSNEQREAAIPATNRLPPLPALPPVGFPDWPATWPEPFSKSQPENSVPDAEDGPSTDRFGSLGPEDFGAIPKAPELPDAIVNGPEEEVADATLPAKTDFLSEHAKKEQARRVPKPQNRPGLVEQTPSAPAADPPPSEPGSSPDRIGGKDGWVIRR